MRSIRDHHPGSLDAVWGHRPGEVIQREGMATEEKAPQGQSQGPPMKIKE